MFEITTEGEEALAAATAETVLCLIGSTACKGRIFEITVSFDGVSATAEPVLVTLLRTTADDGTATAATEKKLDPDWHAPNCAGKHSYTAEPTKESTYLKQWNVHPQGGLLLVQRALGDEWILDDTTSNGIAIVCTAPAVVNVVAGMSWRE